MKVLHLLASGYVGGIETLIKNIALQDSDNVVCFTFDGGVVADEMIQKKCNVYLLKSSKKQFKNLINEIKEIIEKENIKVIITHHGGIYSNIIYLKLKKLYPDLKFIKELHCAYIDEYNMNTNNLLKKIMFNYVLKQALKKSDYLLAVSNYVKTTYKKFNIDNKCKVIYNGIPKKNIIENKKEFKSNSIKLIYVGRLSKVKGVQYLLEAIRKINEMDSTIINLIIVGSGEYEEELKKIKEQYSLLNVKFVGTQNNVINWLDKSDIFVYPSIWEEAFGISVLEAMGRGLIPITFSKGGLVEFIKNDYNGFICEDVDVDLLKNKILEVVELINKKKISKISQNAIDTSKNFTIERTIENLKNTYEELGD